MLLDARRWITNIVFFCLMFSAIQPAFSETIENIQVEGNRTIEKAVIIENLVSKQGSNLRKATVASDVEQLYRLGYFDFIHIYFDDITHTLRVVVHEKKRIKSVKFEGNDELDKDDLTELTTVKPFTFYDQQKINESIDKIKSKYQDKGFYLAEVSTKQEDAGNGDIDLVFVVSENKKIKVRKVTLLGVKTFSEDEIKKTMITKEKGFLSFATGSGMYRQEVLAQDRQIIRDYYGRRGYIKAKVSQPTVQITPDKTSLSVTFQIEEGESYDVHDVSVTGDLLTHTPEELMQKVKLKPKTRVDTSLIQQDITELTGVYANDGYAYVNVIPQDSYDEENKLVNIVYTIQPGPKVRIHRIRFSGNLSTRDKVLRREVQLAEGEWYSAEKLLQTRQNLERLALFEEVKITTPVAGADDEVDVVIDIKEKQTGTFSIGAGFNTLESFQVLGRIEKRNLFGYGVDLSLDARVGKLTQVFNLQYRDEHFLDSNWGFTGSGFNIQQRFTNFDLTTRGGTLGFDYPLYEKGLERIRFGVTYSLVDKNIGGLRPTLKNVFTGGLTSSTIFSLSRDTRNRVFDPSDGSLTRITEEVAGGPFGGVNEFLKTEFDGRWFYNWLEGTGIPWIKDSFFSLGLRVGYVSPLQNGGRVPLFERYFPGGILTLRGFLLRSLGPKIQVASSEDPANLDSSDFTIGGNKQVILNVEYIFPIIKPANIRGVVFFDMGNAFDSGESIFTLTGQRQSAGFGIRWLSPIGPLRFEWGYPLDKKKDEKSSVFDFTIGSIF